MSTATVPAWRRCDAVLRHRRRLSPTFLLLTLAGPDLRRVADNGADQRVKLAFGVPGHGLRAMPSGPDWYHRWRALPDALRPPLRTFTLRAVRADAGEVDIVVATHDGAHGPAARWALAAEPGDPVALIAPDAGHPGDHGGREFRPGAASRVLILADETAAPAVVSILEGRHHHGGHVLVEVPHPADRLPHRPGGPLRPVWLPRGDRPPGSLLLPAALRLLGGRHVRTGEGGAAHGGPEPAPDGEELPWDVPDGEAAGDCYVWAAGEASLVAALRRAVRAAGQPAALMGYWRLTPPAGAGGPPAH